MRLLERSVFLAALLSLTSFGSNAQDTLHRAIVFKTDEPVCYWNDSETGFLLAESYHLVGQYAGGPLPQRGKTTCRGTHDLDIDLVITKGDLCVFNQFWTTDTIFVATPGGEWMVQCQFKKLQ
jgi:hypothetical protein